LKKIEPIAAEARAVLASELFCLNDQ
jgi:hypothetical protein